MTAAGAGLALAIVTRLVSSPLAPHGAGSGSRLRLSRPDPEEHRARPRLRGESLGPRERRRRQRGTARPARCQARARRCERHRRAVVVLACLVFALGSLLRRLLSGRREQTPMSPAARNAVSARRPTRRRGDLLARPFRPPGRATRKRHPLSHRYSRVRRRAHRPHDSSGPGRRWEAAGNGATLAVAGGGLCLFLVAASATQCRVPGRPDPVATLASFLEAHHLHEGIGDYWSAAITTVESGGKVVVRPC